jgi:hypothetical protein
MIEEQKKWEDACIEQYVQRILDYYPIALNDVQCGIASQICVSYTTSDDTLKSFLGSRQPELAAKFHAIQCIAHETVIKAGNTEVNYLLGSKNIELVREMVKREWLPEEFSTVKNVNVTFLYKVNLNLNGMNAAHFNNILNFAHTLYTLKGYYNTRGNHGNKLSALSPIITDALKLWMHGLMSLHPNLSIWKKVEYLILPLHPDNWPVRIPKWVRRPNKDIRKQDLLSDFYILSKEYVKLQDEGKTDIEIREMKPESIKEEK